MGRFRVSKLAVKVVVFAFFLRSCWGVLESWVR